MKKVILIFAFFSISFANSGKISGVTFFDFSQSGEEAGFNFVRQYFSYGTEVSENVKFKVVFDVGRTNNKDLVIYEEDKEISEDARLTAFLKKAQMDYTNSLGKFSLGVIGMNTYHIQEKNWGYRFMEKPALDLYKFSSTADLGIGFYRSLGSKVNLSFLMTNGEGYKKPQGDQYFKYSVNASIGEQNLTKSDGFNLGVVGSNSDTKLDPVNMVGIFGGYAGYNLRIGGEFEQQTTGDLSETIFSSSLNYSISDKLDVFTRFDNYDNNEENDKVQNQTLTGIVYELSKGVMIAPNIRKKNNEDPELRVNFQIKF